MRRPQGRNRGVSIMSVLVKTGRCNGISQVAKFMGPTWGPTGSCRPQMGPMLAPWTLLSGLTIPTDNGHPRHDKWEHHGGVCSTGDEHITELNEEQTEWFVASDDKHHHQVPAWNKITNYNFWCSILSPTYMHAHVTHIKVQQWLRYIKWLFISVVFFTHTHIAYTRT